MSPLIVFALFFVGVYFLLLRPQQQRVRRQRDLISAIGVGDRVVTAGGLIGRVVDESDDRLLLEVADGVVVEFLRLAISRRLDEAESAFAFSGVAAADDSAPDAPEDEEPDEEEAAAEVAPDPGVVAPASASPDQAATVGDAEIAAAVDPAPPAPAPGPKQDPH